MKVFIGTDVEYGYYLSDDWGLECEVPVEVVEEYKFVKEHFEDVQNKLQMIYLDTKEKNKLEACKKGVPSYGFD